MGPFSALLFQLPSHQFTILPTQKLSFFALYSYLKSFTPIFLTFTIRPLTLNLFNTFSVPLSKLLHHYTSFLSLSFPFPRDVFLLFFLQRRKEEKGGRTSTTS